MSNYPDSKNDPLTCRYGKTFPRLDIGTYSYNSSRLSLFFQSYQARHLQSSLLMNFIGLTHRLPAVALLTYLPALTFAHPLHTNNSVICNQADWRNLLLFFLVNYASHAATIALPAGAKPLTSIPWILIALFFPLSGLGRAIGFLLSYPLYKPLDKPDLDEVKKAAIRGALVVTRWTTEWRPATTHREKVYLKLLRKPEIEAYVV